MTLWAPNIGLSGRYPDLIDTPFFFIDHLGVIQVRSPDSETKFPIFVVDRNLDRRGYGLEIEHNFSEEY